MRLEIGTDGLPVRCLEIHSFRKPMLLRYYLNPLTLILSKRFQRICYIDGFSGPGKVRFKLDGESYDIDGSPLTALKARPGFRTTTFATLVRNAEMPWNLGLMECQRDETWMCYRPKTSTNAFRMCFQ